MTETPSLMPQPGDVFFTRTHSLVAKVIRKGSESHWAHCGVVHADLGDGLYLTAEAFGNTNGLQWRHRTIRPGGPGNAIDFLLMRPALTLDQMFDLLKVSATLVEVSTGYDWAEIGRLAARFAGIDVSPLDNNPRRWICSGHCATAIAAARPDLAARFPVPAHGIWPGALREALGGVCFELRDFTTVEPSPLLFT